MDICHGISGACPWVTGLQCFEDRLGKCIMRQHLGLFNDLNLIADGIPRDKNLFILSNRKFPTEVFNLLSVFNNPGYCKLTDVLGVRKRDIAWTQVDRLAA